MQWHDNFISHNVIPGQRQQTHRTDTQREENRGKLKKDSHEISSADCPRSVEEDDGKVGFHFLRCFRISTRCKDVLILNLPELVNKGRENMTMVCMLIKQGALGSLK